MEEQKNIYIEASADPTPSVSMLSGISVSRSFGFYRDSIGLWTRELFTKNGRESYLSPCVVFAILKITIIIVSLEGHLIFSYSFILNSGGGGGEVQCLLEWNETFEVFKTVEWYMFSNYCPKIKIKEKMIQVARSEAT